MMRERPMLFSGAMVRAILEGRKTQTRRVMRVQPPGTGYEIGTLMATTGNRRDVGRQHWILRDGNKVVDGKQPYFLCPYGQPGDRLWVREAFWQAHSYPGCTPGGEPEPQAWLRGSLIHYAADGNPPNTPNHHYPNGLDGAHYFSAPNPYAAWEKRPSIHMPRWASRITLKVTEVRVQRIQDITEDDARAEGLACLTKDASRTWKWGLPDRDGLPGKDDFGWPWDQWCTDPVQAYRRLWDQINAGRGFGWDSNPWVWAITYRDITAQAQAEAA